MNDNLEKCDLMLLFCSPNALKSKAVKDEWMAAHALRKLVIPIFMKVEYIPTLLRSYLGIEYDMSDTKKNIQNIYDLILKKLQII